MPHSQSLAGHKQMLRKEALARRAALDPIMRVEASLALADFADCLALPAGAVVGGFWPIRDEIDPRPLMDMLRGRGYVLSLPVVADPHLIFRVFGPDSRFEPAGFGTQAPGEEAQQVRPDVLLMPLAAFDNKGNRIGYGKGHYDTAIDAFEKEGPVMCIGLAFGIQEVPHISAEPHDKPLDGILTEAGLRRFTPSEAS